MDDQLFQPLLPTTATTTTTATSSAATCTPISSTVDDDNEYHYTNIFSSNPGIILRLVTFVSVGLISLWANFEASKGFDITIINDINDTPAGKRFTLSYMSNDKAVRIIQNTSFIIETVLYPDTNFTKKKVDHVTLRLLATNQTSLVTVITSTNQGEFVINVSPSAISVVDNKHLESQIKSVVVQAMSRIWLWDGKPMAPPWLLDGIVEYTKKVVAGSDEMKMMNNKGVGHFCSGDKSPRYVAEFLESGDKVRKGFIQRLNQGLRDGWNDRTVENALGMPAKNLCHSFGNSSREIFG